MKNASNILFAIALVIATFLSAEAVAQTSPSAFTTAYRYDVGGQLTGRIEADPDGSSGPLGFPAIRNSYDANGRLISAETGELASWQGDAVQPKDWVGYTVFQIAEFSYDTKGRKIRELTRQGAGVYALKQISYDAYDRVDCDAIRMDPVQWLSQTNACVPQLGSGTIDADRITKTTYNNRNQPLQIKRAVGTSLEQAYVTYTYSNPYKPAFVTDANGNKTRLCYDDFVRQSMMILPSKTVIGSTSGVNDADAICAVSASSDYESYAYDANGNRTSLRKRDGSIITYQFDALNRNTVKVVPERSGLSATHTRDVYYGYDFRGLQTYARFDGASGEGVASSYDGFGRLASASQTMDAVTRTLTYAYDNNGNRTQTNYPDGNNFQFGYDGLNRMSVIGRNAASGLTGYVFNNRGLRESLASGSWTYYSYDPVGRLNTLTQDFAGTANDVAYGFGYNPASQITTRSTSNDAFVYTGDVNVNRSYAVNGLNQYASAGPASFSYDGNANLIGDGSNAYVYDVENRLVSASGATSASLRYDPLGRLYETSGGPAGTTRFLYDGDELIAEYDGSGSMLRRYVHGSGVDDPIATFEGSGVADSAARLIKTNHQGSVIAYSDWNGNLAAINAYDEWGIPAAANIGRFQYTGQAWISELRMYYYKARIYSPTLGRFLQTDPIGYDDQLNLYAYVGNDPVNRTDPTGLRSAESIAAEEAVKRAAAEAARRTASPAMARAAAGIAVRAMPLAATLTLGCDSPPCSKTVHATYTKTNLTTGQVYSGRTRITVPGGTPTREAGLAAVARRDSGHHTNGFGPAVLDKASENGGAIRGREQQLIDYNGGARSVGGTSGNAINGIWDYNPLRPLYMNSASSEFGSLPSNRPGE